MNLGSSSGGLNIDLPLLLLLKLEQVVRSEFGRPDANVFFSFFIILNDAATSIILIGVLCMHCYRP
jgi:hypothetical protein